MTGMSGKILVADDNQINILLIKSIFKRFEEIQLNLAADGEEAITSLQADKPDLILLDIMMPKKDGFEVARFVKETPALNDVPIIFLTALADESFKLKAFEIGGIDYVTKPINKNELVARVNAQLQIKKIQDELRIKNALLKDRELHLSKLVDEKTQEIHNVTMAMVTALESANHFNDEDTGNHIRRVSEFSALLAEGYGCENEFVRKVRLFSSLHDVGKVGIPDSILKKPGRLTDEEWVTMRQHVVIGHEMLNQPGIDPMARNIALFHHEKWDGTGYVGMKKGMEIPLEARIVMLADVFDALTQKRVYKDAFPIEKATDIIIEGKGSHFEPKLVELYVQFQQKFLDIKHAWE